jgi:hypothetical protein
MWILRLVQFPALEPVVMALAKIHIPAEDGIVIPDRQDGVRFDHPAWVDDKACPDTTVMTHTTAHRASPGADQLAAMLGHDWLGEQVKVGKGVAGTYE